MDTSKLERFKYLLQKHRDNISNWLSRKSPETEIIMCCELSNESYTETIKDKLVTQQIEQALEKISLKASISRLPLLNTNNGCVNLVSGVTLQSKDLAELFSGCKEILFMGATAGREIAQAISEYSSGKNMTKAVVFDAVGSEMADAALDWVTKFFSNSLRRENKGLTKRRFSAGYGDFELKNQKIIYEVLELEKLDVEITPSFLLVPEKTVTALIGIKEVS